MKNIYQKFKNWYRGKYIPLSAKEMFALVKQSQRYLEKQKLNTPDRFKRPLIARIINSAWRFWFRHGKWIIRTIIAFGILIIMVMEYYRK